MGQLCVWSATGGFYVVHWLSWSVIPFLVPSSLVLVVDWVFLTGTAVSMGGIQASVSTYPPAVDEDAGTSWATLSSFLWP